MSSAEALVLAASIGRNRAITKLGCMTRVGGERIRSCGEWCKVRGGRI